MSHPMDRLPNAGRPLLRRVVSGSFEKLAVKYEGLDVYGDAHPSLQNAVAPALNFFAVRTERRGGWTHSIHKIEIGPQSAELFEPPPGAMVRESQQKAGFRMTSKGNASLEEIGAAEPQ